MVGMVGRDHLVLVAKLVDMAALSRVPDMVVLNRFPDMAALSRVLDMAVLNPVTVMAALSRVLDMAVLNKVQDTVARNKVPDTLLHLPNPKHNQRPTHLSHKAQLQPFQARPSPNKYTSLNEWLVVSSARAVVRSTK